MRSITKALIALVAVCALPGCEGEDPVNGEVPDCGSDPGVFITFPDVSVDRPYAHIVDFEWTGDTDCEIQSTRYLILPISEDDDIIADLNGDPGSFEESWSEWRTWYHRPGGNAVRLESELMPGMPGGYNNTRDWHLFAVQARSRDGKVTEEFAEGRNVRTFDCEYRREGPRISMEEMNYLGDLIPYIQYPYLPYPGARPRMEIPGGIRLKLRIDADAEYYGRRVAGYRFGWDVPDLERWGKAFTEDNEIPEIGFDEGEHLLTIEVIDDIGLVSSVTFNFDFIPMTMERDLLWVDDFPGMEYPDPSRIMPTEDEHDQFWEGVCATIGGFDPGGDIYDVIENGGGPPSIELLSHYKNVIWTYSSSSINNAWRQMLRPSALHKIVNYLPMFMARGGHIWSLGRPGGLGTVLPDGTCIPASVECPPDGDCGIERMPFRDYGVTVVDKVIASFCTGDAYPPDVISRSVTRDALRFAITDGTDPVTLSFPGLPDTLRLWAEITDCPSCFFNLYERGFSYVEVYDPAYWMDAYMLESRPEFHPMYRMRAMSSLSPLHQQTLAIWVTKYQDVVPAPASGPAVAAPSVHMGFPLWFFDHDQAGQIAGVIFGAWGIAE